MMAAVAVFLDAPIETSMEYRALFIQDSWQITPYFNLQYGLRYEEQTIEGSSAKLEFDDNYAPRAGFTWDVTKDGKSKLYGSLGRYYEKIPNESITRRYASETAGVVGYYYFTPATTDVNGDGAVNAVDGVPGSLENPVPGQFSVLFAPGTDPVDPDVENGYADELVLGYEYEIRPDFAIGARFVYRELGEVLEQTQTS
jgi:hypothetical protein